MGDAMEEASILQWLKSEGDNVSEQETIAEVQTEKATIEIPATAGGVLTRILVPVGLSVPVGTPIARLGNDPADEAEIAGGAATQASPGPEQRPATPPTPTGDGREGPHSPGGRVKASPLARKVAAEHGIDLETVRGTGPGGRIVESDVEDALATRPVLPPPTFLPAPAALPVVRPALAGTERPLSPMRRVIGKRLSESKQTIPHFYLNIEVDMRAAVRLRSEFNAARPDEPKISFNDLVARACVIALQRHPQLNCRLEGDRLVYPAGVNLGVAVSLDDGLIVPVVKGAESRPVTLLAEETRSLAARARTGQLGPDDYTGGSFTISNLGMYDISHFQAIINPPEAAILAVGAIRDTPIVEDGQIVAGKQMSLTISVDHRAVDGHTAAQFLQEVKKLLQAPIGLLS